MTCYFPDGAISTQDVPCIANAKNSHCCRANDICLDNGYCLGAYASGPNSITRASCTDSSFMSEPCPQACKDVHPVGAATLYMYNFASPANYCCGPYNTTSGRCNDKTLGSTLPFILSNGNFITNRTDGTIWGLNLTQPSISKTSTCPTTTATTSATAAFETGTANCSSEATFSDHHANAIGMAVGIPLGLLLLVATAGLVFQRYLHQRAERRWLRDRQALMGCFATEDVRTAVVPEGKSKTIHELRASHAYTVQELGGTERRWCE